MLVLGETWLQGGSREHRIKSFPEDAIDQGIFWQNGLLMDKNSMPSDPWKKWVCTHCHKKWCCLYNVTCHNLNASYLHFHFLTHQYLYCHPDDPTWHQTIWSWHPDKGPYHSSIVIQYVRQDQDEMQIRKNVTATSLFVTLSNQDMNFVLLQLVVQQLD